MAIGTSRVATGDPGTGEDRAPPGQAASWAGLLLLMAVAIGLLGQGAYYGPAQRLLGLLVAAATLLALVAWPLTRDDLRRLPLVPAAALAGWALLDALLLGQPVAGAAGLALLLAGLVAVLAVCRRLGREDRDVLLIGVIGPCWCRSPWSGWPAWPGRRGLFRWWSRSPACWPGRRRP